MRNLLLGLLLLININTYSQFWKPLEKRNHSLNKLLKDIKTFDDFSTATLGFYAEDINTGEVISSINKEKSFRPASTLKLLTTATALELLGPDHRFETRLEYSGSIDTLKRLLDGNIYIMGGGDPTLGSRYFDSTSNKQFLNKWIKAVKAMGIDSISGAVIGDGRVLSRDIVPASWMWEDMASSYGHQPCGLTVYDNNYSIYLNTGSNVGDTAEIMGQYPSIPGIVFNNTITADSVKGNNAGIYGAPYTNIRCLRGRLPLNKINYRLRGSVPDPALLAAVQLDSALSVNSIATGKPATTIRIITEKDAYVHPATNHLSNYWSPELREIIAQANIHSINLFTELLHLHSGIKLNAVPETEVAADSVEKFWAAKGMDIKGLSMNDGSGVSWKNIVRPDQIVYMLKYMRLNSLYFNDYFNSLAIAGLDGTIEDMFKGSLAEGKLRAKSGTLTRTKAYSGYVTSASGREIAFYMVVNNYTCPTSMAEEKLEQLMIALATFNK